ncbi:MAG: hypothetical protein LBJ46_07750 [Planctomycetota bacterium]|jgi:hypothetical protein|nr:hypothetical protein [Planctomycetota bacterium]
MQQSAKHIQTTPKHASASAPEFADHSYRTHSLHTPCSDIVYAMSGEKPPTKDFSGLLEDVDYEELASALDFEYKRRADKRRETMIQERQEKGQPLPKPKAPPKAGTPTPLQVRRGLLKARLAQLKKRQAVAYDGADIEDDDEE